MLLLPQAPALESLGMERVMVYRAGLGRALAPRWGRVPAELLAQATPRQAAPGSVAEQLAAAVQQERQTLLLLAA